MRFYSREQMIELVGIDGGFLVALEREEIVRHDAPEAERLLGAACSSARASPTSWSHELDVNVAGAGDHRAHARGARGACAATCEGLAVRSSNACGARGEVLERRRPRRR